MDELQMIASLLQDPSQIKFCHVNPEWFQSKVCQDVVKAVQATDGEVTHIPMLVDTLNEARSPFDRVTMEELELLRDSYEPSDFSANVKYLHKNRTRQQLIEKMRAYNTDKKTSHLADVKQLIDELESIDNYKLDGSLEANAMAYREHLYTKHVNSLRTYPVLDSYLNGGFRKGQLVTLGARTGVGKTLVALNLVDQLFKHNENMRVDYFSFEMDFVEIMNRLIAKNEGIHASKLSNAPKMTDEERQRAWGAFERFKQTRDLAIWESQFGYLGALKQKIRERATGKANHYVAVVDHIGILKVEGVKDTSDAGKRILISHITRDLKLLAAELDITIIILSQLNRGANTQNKPTLANLKDSGTIEEDSSVVLFVYLANEQENKEEAILEIAKNRQGMIGRLGYRMNYGFMDFEEMPIAEMKTMFQRLDEAK